ncbi:PhzF family phenazine biosynthesis protein [Aestuariivirga litoralis]|uniref:PhzF family phenazine biosynthesis protein n=1 Tax=Aestuariivirga litoralis TaxID=2650924 RepID=UPI0018C83FFC|nr:PhzF family phenazine biosynthesis protein [Aestuariivirga litoralis]MBG1231384.1 PhzF family phenazine biosynthesis protein [Aestuariivirga litoralis]
MKLEFYTLDVFTAQRFSGNPLAVVLDADGLTTAQMQTITKEFNLSETTFVMKPENPANTAKVRIFFPGGEMPFAGHPTLGTAILLAELKNKPGCSLQTEIRLELPAGLTPVKVSRIADRMSGIFTAPVIPFHVDIALPSVEDTARALNLDAADIGFGSHQIASLEGGPRFFYVPVKTRAALEKSKVLEPYWSALIKPMQGVVAAYIYTPGGDGPQASYRARMYAPTGGIPEDPATGSATALLAAQLLTAEKLADGKHSWNLEQGYEMGRPSDLRLEADVKDGALTAVRVGGSAIRMMSGEIEL